MSLNQWQTWWRKKGMYVQTSTERGKMRMSDEYKLNLLNFHQFINYAKERKREEENAKRFL